MIEWRRVPSYPWLEASSDGRVRRIAIGANGRRPREIVGSISTEGYRVTCTSQNHVKAHNVGFHVLVCEAFHGVRPSPEHEAAHGDGQRAHNVPTNLRWATPLENAADRKLHGTNRGGEQHPGAKLTPADVLEIRMLKMLGYRGRDIAALFEINRHHANKIAAGKLWADVIRPEFVFKSLLGFGA